MDSPINPPDIDKFRRDQERWKERRERPFARELNAIFNKAGREAAAAYDNGLDPFSGPYLTNGLDAALTETMRRRMTGIAIQWARAVERGAKMFPDFQQKSFQEDVRRYIDQFVATYTARKVVQISDTTRTVIRDSIDAGVQEQLGPAAVARLIRERNSQFSRFRAMRIARTETSMIANATSEFSADALGLEYKRRWVAAADERTRDSHAEADGQIRGRDEAFDVGDSKLMRPGDPTGPASEIINCRCSVALVRV